MMQKGARGCQGVPAGDRWYQRVPEGARGCQMVPEGARWGQRVTEGARGARLGRSWPSIG